MSETREISRSIPADVLKAASAAFADTKVISASLVAEDEDSDVLPFILARAAYAILAERERCAKIADEVLAAAQFRPVDGSGIVFAARAIASSIRSPDTIGDKL